MIPKRLRRALIAGGLTIGLLMAPITALAALPAGWGVEVTPLPSTVSPGANAGFELDFTNAGPSTISQLYLFTVNGPYDPVYAKSSQGSCDISDQLMCDLGQVKANSGVTIVVAFATSADDTSASFSVDFAFNTAGLGSTSGDNSHGDSLPASGTAQFDANGGDFSGTFVVNSGNPVANSGPSVGGQGTTLYPPVNGIPVTVEDGPGVTNVACPAAFTCVGETSEIHVGDGSDSYGLFKVVIVIDKTAFADVTSPNLQVIHVYDDGTTYDEITTACPRNGKPTTECATVSSGRYITITVWLAQNGFIKYH
jgi:hypothetical protein